MGIVGNRHNNLGKYLERPFDQVNMTVGNRVKASGIYCSLAHSFYKMTIQYPRILTA